MHFCKILFQKKICTCMKSEKKKEVNEPQTQPPPGSQEKMKQQPVSEKPEQQSSYKLKDKIAFITGGDSGIGKAVALLFAKEGADVAIVYLSEREDAAKTKEEIETKHKRKCLLIEGDISNEKFCK